MTRALFFDRDGTVMIDTGYVRNVDDVVLLEGVAEGLRRAKELGYELIQVSNQSGVARGIISEEQLAAVQARLESLLAAQGVALDLVMFCKHGPDDDCACRKPKPGMLLEAAKRRGIDLAQSIMVGDAARDIAAGRAAGCTTILVSSTSSDVRADYTIDSFVEVQRVAAELAAGGIGAARTVTRT